MKIARTRRTYLTAFHRIIRHRHGLSRLLRHRRRRRLTKMNLRRRRSILTTVQTQIRTNPLRRITSLRPRSKSVTRKLNMNQYHRRSRRPALTSRNTVNIRTLSSRMIRMHHPVRYQAAINLNRRRHVKLADLNPNHPQGSVRNN